MARKPDVGAEEEVVRPGDEDERTLTGEIMWNIAIGKEPCDDPKIVTDAKSYAAVRMRQDGTEYREIAAFLNVSIGWAWKLVDRAMRKTIADSVDTIRAVHLRRLDAMLAGVMDRATAGDTFAITAAIQIMGKIEALMGIEPPKKVEHTFGGAQTDDARIALAAAIAAVAPAVEDRRDTEDPSATRH